MDQRNCIEIKCARRFEILTMAFGESTMSRTQDQMWYNWLKEGREDANVDDKPMKTLKQ